ncbi:RE2 [Symbiodinium sp. CCMP2456]|nr:RE2 [Symbiodinium sp. CCMP2456]
MMMRELLMIVNLMMIQIGDLVRAEGMNPAVAILEPPRVMIMVPRTGSVRTLGVFGVRTTSQTGGIIPLGETVVDGGAATDGKIAGGASGIHGALPPPTLVPPTAARGTIASNPPVGRPETVDGTMARELRSSARKTLVVNAWRRMTRLSPDQQALTLYQNLSGKAWIDAEKLDMDSLAAPGGVEYFLNWIKERYLDVQITQVGRSLSGFFRGLRRKPTQSVREYLSEFDRAHARLNEIGCCLPELAAAWVFVDRMGLDEQAELNLLASVGNVYNLQQLQKAAIVHDRSLRKPWEANSRSDRSPPRREWLPRRPQTAHLTGHGDGEEDNFFEAAQDVAEDDVVPEEVAAEYYESFMTHETAKQKYKDTLKLRGSDPESLRKLSEAGGSGNAMASGGNGSSSAQTSQRTGGPGAPRNDGMKQHVVHVTWDLRDQGSEDLLAITDTACSRSVAGIHWINSYVAMAKRTGFNVEFVHIQEAFRFGASRVFEARHAAVIYFDLGEKVIGLKVAVVYGEVPLLISRPALGSLGMIMDVAGNRATFRALGVTDLPLQMTETGHPAFPVHPVDPRGLERKAGDWQTQEVEIFSRSQQYTVFALSSVNISWSEYTWCLVGLFSVELQCPAVHFLILSHTMAPKLLTAPMAERPKTVWELRKDELLREAAARNLAVNPQWTVVELRSVILEDIRENSDPSSSTPTTPGLSKMNLQQLKDKVREIGLEVPEKHNRGLLMRMIRDHGGQGPQTLLVFGRFKGMRYIDTPVGYRTWAVKEVANNDNASEDLRMFAAWWRGESEKHGVVHQVPYRDPEAEATIPYVAEASEMETLWERVSSRVPSGAQAKSLAYPGLRPTAIPKRRAAPSESSLSSRPLMEQDVPEEILDEVQHLEERLAILRDRHGLPVQDENYFDNVEKDAVLYKGQDHEAKTECSFADSKETDSEKFPLYLNHGLVQDDGCQDIKGNKERGYESLSGPTWRHSSPVPEDYDEDYDEIYFDNDQEKIAYLNECNQGRKLEASFADSEETKSEKFPLYLNHGPVISDKHPVVPTRDPGRLLECDGQDLFETILKEEYSLCNDTEHEALVSTSTSSPSTALLKCESLAKEKLKVKAFTFQDLLEISELIPLRKSKKHRCISGDSQTVVEHLVAGMYTHGPFTGLTNNTRSLPWTIRYINTFGRNHVNSSWSSWVLSRNVKSSLHSDSHNHKDTKITSFSFGDFAGGELWVEESNPEDPESLVQKTDDSGNVRMGRLVCTKEKPYVFDPKTKHCTEEWQGDRWVLAFFTPRGYSDSLAGDRETLRDLRFPLKELPLNDNHHDFNRAPRPQKSVRKGLWKTARRLATMTAWCTMAASSFVTNSFPPGRKQGAAVLFEVGDITKTLEIADSDFVCMEPLLPEDFGPQDHLADTRKSIEEFEPEVMWVHVEKLGQRLEQLREVFEAQIQGGRPLIFQFEETCSFPEGQLDGLLDKYEGNYEWPSGPRKTLSFNGRHRDAIDDTINVLGENPVFESYMATGGARGSDEPPPDELPRGASAISFSKGETIPLPVQSSLKRLHQNLGHASPSDMARHLRLAGADPAVVGACKRMRCQVCDRQQRGSSPRPASLPNLLEFNQIVAVDAFTTYDTYEEKIELLIAVDLGTGFCLASELDGHSGRAMETTFCRMWSQTFGAPGTLLVDLETGLQAGLARFSEWHGTILRPIAAQAHWQQGVVERCIRTWKEVWSRVVDDKSVIKKEAPIAITSVNSAMNTLRRQTGFSPSQAVWGRDPRLPEDLNDHNFSEHFHHVLSKDRLRAREHTLRVAAKESFFKTKNDEKLRRALLQRSRVSGSDLEVGMYVFMYRKPKDSKTWKWFGPATIIGREGGNYWASYAGRCHLIAPEHIRIASGEELGAAFTMRTTSEDLEKLLEQPFAEEEIFAGDDNDEAEADPELPPGDDEAMEGDEGEDNANAVPRVAKRYRTKGPQDLGDEIFDELYVSTVGREGHAPFTNYMMKLPKTPRAKEKALEKEIPWSIIPENQRDGFRQAERTQYDEHLQHGALQPLSVEASREVLRTKHDRVLGSRFAYRDKYWSKRKEQPEIGWKHKARLVIAGHRDPDLMSGLSTHAPTVSRQGILLLLQILASNLHRGWTGHAGDVTAAFLCGEELTRELYLRQPRSGLGDLHPEQLLRIRKPIFGLVDSPAAWWGKFRKSLTSMRIDDQDRRTWVISNCSLDHCIFIVQEEVQGEDGVKFLRAPEAYIGVHVDDVLLVGDDQLCGLIKEKLSEQFPIREWESESFDYVGSYVDIKKDMVIVSQASYTATRLFEVEIMKGQDDEEMANEVQKHDNMSLIGALSWLASQSRPDLQVGVSMCQQRQREPTVADIKFTNLLAQRAYEHQKEGIRIHPINLDRAVLLCYHDAGWANVPQSQEDPYYSLTAEEDEAGRITTGPQAKSGARAKRANSSVCSQLGGLFLLADESVLHGHKNNVSIMDWRSGACDRVCRSTFAAETMACATAIETGIFISRFLETLLSGKLARNASRLQLRFLSDCRSLYDHLIRDGVPRVPSCKRLAIDLAAIRDDLSEVGKIAWVPTGAQMSDHLTKPLKAGEWWNQLSNGIQLTFKEDFV